MCINLTNYDFNNYLVTDLYSSGSDTTTNIEINNPNLIFCYKSYIEIVQAAEWLGIEYNPFIYINLIKEIDPQLLSYLINSTTFISLVTLAYSLEKEDIYSLKNRSSIKDKDPNNSILK
jgi:hypothetical protein